MPTPEKIDDEHSLQSLKVDGRCLRVLFEKQGDRFAHSFQIIDDQKILPLLASIEGDSQDISPTSPPIQQLLLQPLGDGRRAALGVGMAGKNHWSISIEPDAQDAALIVDVACRIHQRPQRLGSSYRTLTKSIASWDPRRALLLRTDSLSVELIADTAEAAATLQVQADQLRANQLRIEPQSKVADSQTLRWKYTLRLV